METAGHGTVETLAGSPACRRGNRVYKARAERTREARKGVGGGHRVPMTVRDSRTPPREGPLLQSRFLVEVSVRACP